MQDRMIERMYRHRNS